jgi:hypothetical protein
MPRISSVQPGSIVGVSLDHFAWRLTLAAVMWGKTPALGLVFAYETPTPYLMVNGQMQDITGALKISLLRCPVQFADSLQDLGPVAEAALKGGDEVADIARMTEAFTLFRNSKVRQDLIDMVVKEATEVIKAYWHLATWIGEGCRDRTEYLALGTRLVGAP